MKNDSYRRILSETEAALRELYSDLLQRTANVSVTDALIDVNIETRDIRNEVWELSRELRVLSSKFGGLKCQFREEQKVSEEMIRKLMTEGITMEWADGREKTIRITEKEAEQLRQGETVQLHKRPDPDSIMGIMNNIKSLSDEIKGGE